MAHRGIRFTSMNGSGVYLNSALGMGRDLHFLSVPEPMKHYFLINNASLVVVGLVVIIFTSTTILVPALCLLILSTESSPLHLTMPCCHWVIRGAGEVSTPPVLTSY
jgi:hypothetical protein